MKSNISSKRRHLNRLKSYRKEIRKGPEGPVHEWDVRLEIFNRPQAKENSRQYLLLATDILQKSVVGCPCILWIKMFYKNVMSSVANNGFFTPSFNIKQGVC